MEYRFDDRVYDLPYRDSRRSRVYAAENLTVCLGAELIGDGSVRAMQAFVDQVLATTTWSELCRVNHVDRRSVPARDGRGSRRARASAAGIWVPREMRTIPIVLHELAHVLTWPRARHHWPFCHAYLALVHRFLGADARDELVAAFRKRAVPFAPPRQRRPLSPERRARLVAQLAAAREAR